MKKKALIVANMLFASTAVFGMDTNNWNEDWKQIRRQRMSQLFGQPQNRPYNNQPSNNASGTQRVDDLTDNLADAAITMEDIRKSVEAIENIETKLEVKDFATNPRERIYNLIHAIEHEDLEKVKQTISHFPDNLAIVNFVNSISRIRNNKKLSNERVEEIIKKHQNDMLNHPNKAFVASFINMKMQGYLPLSYAISETWSYCPGAAFPNAAYYEACNSIARLLIQHGADVNKADGNGHTPLHHAVNSSNILMVKYLVEHGSDINAADHKGDTPLHWAEFMGREEEAEYLINHGADINKKNKFGHTALHSAISSRCTHVSILRQLLEHGADINSRDKKGDTPLHIAVDYYFHSSRYDFDNSIKWGYREKIIYLVNNGADVRAANNKGETPIGLSVLNRDLRNFLNNGGYWVDTRIRPYLF